MTELCEPVDAEPVAAGKRDAIAPALQRSQSEFVRVYRALKHCRTAVSNSDFISTYRIEDLMRDANKRAYDVGRAHFIAQHRQGLCEPKVDDQRIQQAFYAEHSEAGPESAYRKLQAAFGDQMQDKVLRDTVRMVIDQFGLRRSDAIQIRAGYAVLSTSMYLDSISRQFGKAEYGYGSVEGFVHATNALLDLLVRIAPPEIAALLRGGVRLENRVSATPQQLSAIAKPPLRFRAFQKKVEIHIPLALVDGLANLVSMYGTDA